MDPYENLAEAIIIKAVDDYRRIDDILRLAEIEYFFRSDWFCALTDIDPEMLIERLRAEKRYKKHRASVVA